MNLASKMPPSLLLFTALLQTEILEQHSKRVFDNTKPSLKNLDTSASITMKIVSQVVTEHIFSSPDQVKSLKRPHCLFEPFSQTTTRWKQSEVKYKFFQIEGPKKLIHLMDLLRAIHYSKNA